MSDLPTDEFVEMVQRRMSEGPKLKVPHLTIFRLFLMFHFPLYTKFEVLSRAIFHL